LLCQIADDREVERYRRSVGHIRTNRAVRASPRSFASRLSPTTLPT
jgi:hypothetical protein